MPERNGFDINVFDGTVAALRRQPKAAQLTFRAAYKWAGGLAGDARLETLEQVGRAIPRTFTLPGDYPPELVGRDHGPSAFETLMAALGSCLTGTYAVQATARGVDIEAIDIELEGHVDLIEFLGVGTDPAQPTSIQARIHVTSSADPSTLAEILEATKDASPCFNALARPLRVDATIGRP